MSEPIKVTLMRLRKPKPDPIGEEELGRRYDNYLDLWTGLPLEDEDECEHELPG